MLPFALNFDLEKKFEKLINDICIGIVLILIRKKWGVTVEILNSNFENVSNERRF